MSGPTDRQGTGAGDDPIAPEAAPDHADPAVRTPPAFTRVPREVSPDDPTRRDRTGPGDRPAEGRTRPKPALFLARDRYRQRRVRDVARMMPALAALFWLIPLLWRQGNAETGFGSAGTSVFLFIAWAVLIVAAFVIARRIEIEDLDPDSLSETARDLDRDAGGRSP